MTGPNGSQATEEPASGVLGPKPRRPPMSAVAVAFGLASFAQSYLLALVVPQTQPGMRYVAWYEVVSALFISPWLETAVFVLLPVALTARFGRRAQAAAGVLGAFAFAVAHASHGVSLIIQALFGGILFLVCFLRYAREGLYIAWLATSCAHLTHNVLTLFDLTFRS